MAYQSMIKDDSQKGAVLNIAQALFQAQIQTHIAHLQSDSYAEHIALGEFYEAAGDLADAIIEKTQGKYGIIKGYKTIQLMDDIDCCEYMKTVLGYVEKQRLSIKEGYLQQLTDNIIEQIASTLYKLENLK